MSEPGDELEGIEAAIRGLIPELSERLERHGLGEIEVRRGDLRVRVASGAAPASLAATADAQGQARGTRGAPHPGAHLAAALPIAAEAMVNAPHASGTGVTAPAVGYFIYADGLGPGLPVEKGDALGYVEVLGVRHDVRAPRSGVVRNLVTEAGEAVEYGQVLIELEAAAS